MVAVAVVVTVGVIILLRSGNVGSGEDSADVAVPDASDLEFEAIPRSSSPLLPAEWQPPAACERQEPADEAGELPAGWSQLPPPPLSTATGDAVWTGDRLLFFAQRATTVYDPETDQWSCHEPPPIEWGTTTAVWAGTEAIVWSQGQLAAYNPRRDEWRQLPSPPAPLHLIGRPRPVAMVWTGSDVIVWGYTERGGNPPAPVSNRGAALDPQTNTWQLMADAPQGINQGAGVWTGDRLIVYGALLTADNASYGQHPVGMAYDPQTDSWTMLSEFEEHTPQATTVAWTNERLVAWDYELHAGAYDPSSDRWSTLPPLPLGFGECYPDNAVLDGRYVFAWYCGQAALFDPFRERWTRLPTPFDTGSLTFSGTTNILVTAGPDIYLARSDALLRYSQDQ